MKAQKPVKADAYARDVHYATLVFLSWEIIFVTVAFNVH